MNKKLTEYSVKELQEALQKKGKVKYTPQVVLSGNSDTNLRLIELAGLFMQDEENGDEVETQYAYELLMQLVYGDNVFDYINNLHD